MGDLLYLLQVYWPYAVAVFIAGVGIGWWAEWVGDGTIAAWLNGEPRER